MANLVLAFAEILAGAVLADAGIKGASIGSVIKGEAVQQPLSGSSSSSSSTAAGAGGATTSTGTGAAGGTATAQKMLAAAQAASGGPYSQANHATAFGKVGSWLKQFGTDCSGFVSYLMGVGGYWNTSYTTDTIPGAPNLIPGQGTNVTIWNNPATGNAGHVFINILGNWFESAGGIGIHQMTAAEAQQYINTGLYSPFHPTGQ